MHRRVGIGSGKSKEYLCFGRRGPLCQDEMIVGVVVVDRKDGSVPAIERPQTSISNYYHLMAILCSYPEQRGGSLSRGGGLCVTIVKIAKRVWCRHTRALSLSKPQTGQFRRPFKDATCFAVSDEQSLTIQIQRKFLSLRAILRAWLFASTV